MPPQEEQTHPAPTSWFLMPPPIKGTRILGEMFDSRAGAAQIQDESGTSCNAGK